MEILFGVQHFCSWRCFIPPSWELPAAFPAGPGCLQGWLVHTTGGAGNTPGFGTSSFLGSVGTPEVEDQKMNPETIPETKPWQRGYMTLQMFAADNTELGQAQMEEKSE